MDEEPDDEDGDGDAGGGEERDRSEHPSQGGEVEGEARLEHQPGDEGEEDQVGADRLARDPGDQAHGDPAGGEHRRVRDPRPARERAQQHRRRAQPDEEQKESLRGGHSGT